MVREKESSKNTKTKIFQTDKQPKRRQTVTSMLLGGFWRSLTNLLICSFAIYSLTCSLTCSPTHLACSVSSVNHFLNHFDSFYTPFISIYSILNLIYDSSSSFLISYLTLFISYLLSLIINQLTNTLMSFFLFPYLSLSFSLIRLWPGPETNPTNLYPLSNSRTRERVSLQSLSNSPTPDRDCPLPGTNRTSDQDLVPESADEG